METFNMGKVRAFLKKKRREVTKDTGIVIRARAQSRVNQRTGRIRPSEIRFIMGGDMLAKEFQRFCS